MVGLRKHNHHLPRRLYMKGRSYYYVTPANKWIALGPDLPAAKRKLLDLEHGPAVAGTVAEMIDRFLAEESPKRAARTHQDNVIAAKRLKAFFGGMSPNSVKPSYVAGFLDRHPAPIRANREVATLSSAYTYAMRKGFAEKNPCYGVRRNPEKPRGRYVEDGEFYAFLRFAEQKYEESERKHDGYLMLCVTAEIAYLTGQRREDVLAVPLRNVRDDGILFEQKKSNGEMRVLVEWTDALRAAVAKAKALPRPVSGLYLICNRRGQPYTGAGFKTMWNRVQVQWKAAGNERFWFHDLRAKAITDMKEQGRDAKEVSGHKTDAMVNRVYDRRRVRRGPAVK